jgi:hypothetical protein
MSRSMVKPNAPERRANDQAEDAIAMVLRAEREAGQEIERTQIEAGRIAEDARACVRSVGERTERRIRAVVATFERELAERLAEIDAEAASIAKPHELTADEMAALNLAVRGLAQELTGVRP